MVTMPLSVLGDYTGTFPIRFENNNQKRRFKILYSSQQTLRVGLYNLDIIDQSRHMRTLLTGQNGL